ncbi:MAG TPA: hypothetical protein VFI11_00305, partial [Anaerolineales bacterium]|nr:hypothetical protein [Anaerolineales bacterium]
MQNLFLMLFLVGGLAGGLRTLRLLARARRPGEFGDVIHRWSEKPLSSWRYEPSTATAVLVHTLSVVALGGAALVATSRPAAFDATSASDSPLLDILLPMAEVAGIGLVGYLVGTLVAFPLSRTRRPTVAFAIVKEGIAYGRTLMPWSWFSHFSIDEANGLLSFHSAFAPGLPSLISKPTTPQLAQELASTIREHLPGHAPPAPNAWYRTRHLLIPAMVVLCMAFVSAGWLAVRLPRESALSAIALSATLLV